MTSSMPAYASCIRFFLAVDKGLHSMVIQAVRFDQIYDVKLVDLILSGVGETEVEPLAELRRAPMVKLQIQVVLKLTYLRRPM